MVTRHFVIALFLAISGIVFSQTTITGIITSDLDNKPLAGVNVLVKGTRIGSITDHEGKYSIMAPISSRSLVFSYIGMISKEVDIEGRTSIDVSMERDLLGLDQVIVIGYGSKKRSDLTGSISSVSNTEYEGQPVTNLAQVLQGRVAGVLVTTNSGAPGGNIKIRIRGTNSLLGDNDPLYVIDGVASDIYIGDLNVNDIESIEVLKDASATAIYGSRGANGVIMITTKRGKSNLMQVTAGVNLGFSSIPKRFDLMEAGSFAEFVNVYRPGYFSQSEIDEFKQTGGVDWQDEIFQTGVSQDYQVSMAGGNEQASYYISGNYLDQTGTILRSSMKKYSTRASLKSDIGKKLSLDFNVFATRMEGLNNGDMGGQQNPVMNALNYSPTSPIYTPEGVWDRTDAIATTNAQNPVMQLMERYDDLQATTITLNTSLNYRITKDLTFDFVLGTHNNSYSPRGYLNEWINQTLTVAYQNEYKQFNWQNSNILSYRKLLNSKHDISLTGIFEQAEFNNSGFQATGTNILPISVGYDNLNIAGGQSIGSFRSRTALRSYVGRFSYIYSEKYLLTATYRADGTTKFQDKNKWGYFPSISAAWRISRESFMQGVDAIENLKLRGSWGVSGNQGIDPYSTIAVIGTTYSTFGLNQSFTGSTIEGADNPDLKWETTAQTNIGIDMSFIRNRISLSADYYVKKTTDLLHRVRIPAYQGGGGVNRNIGEMENKGYEIVISGIPVSREGLSLDLSLNMTANRNTLMALGADTLFLGGNYSTGLTQESPFVVKVGEPLGSFWGYEWMGIYTLEEADEAAIYGFTPGDNKYLDWNNDGAIDSGDKHVIGNALPKFTWGLSSSLRYKNLGLDMLIDGVHGNKVLNISYASSATIFSAANTITHSDGLDYWRPENENAMFPDPASSTNKNEIVSTQFLQDGSFVKLRNIALSYTLDKSRLKFASLKFSLSAQNLITITSYKGFDPEASTSGRSDINGSLDLGAYPSARTITLGIQGTF